MTAGDRVRVAAADELEPGDRAVVSVDGVSVGVFNVGGEYYALENECSHQGGPVCSGRIGGKIVGEHRGIGKRTVERISDQQVLACPWHGWEYDIETGRHIGSEHEEYALRTFDVEVDDGDVYVVP